MATTQALIGTLKRVLKHEGVTYADVARELRLSESSVKRLFFHRQPVVGTSRRDLCGGGYRGVGLAGSA